MTTRVAAAPDRGALETSAHRRALETSARRRAHGLARRDPALVVAAAATSAVALWLASPAVGAWWLAWPALVPAAAVTLRGSRPSRLAVPLAYGIYLELLLVPALPFGLSHGQRGDPPLPIEIAGSPAPFVAAVAVPLAVAVLYALRFGRPWPSRRGPTVPAAVVYPAACWVALDLVRTKLDPGGLWGPLFLGQHAAPTAGLSTLGGPWTATFAIVATGYALALPVVRGRRAAGGTTVVVGLVAMLLAGSALASAPAGPRAMTVAAVQPGYDTTKDDLPVLRYFRPGTRHLASLDLIDDLAPLTRAAARQGARLVAWPEATVWADPRREPAVRSALRRLARATGATLVVPYYLPGRERGATVVVGPDGSVSRPQPKQRPMWFLGERGGDGRPPRPVVVGGMAVGALMGVDNQDPALARRLAAEGAHLVTSSTHDWPQLAIQQRAFSELHAIASGIPLVRADWRHGSAVYDSGGRRVADAGIGLRRTVVVAAVSPGGRPTPYRRLGDTAGWAVACAATALAAIAALRSRRERRSGRSGGAARG